MRLRKQANNLSIFLSLSFIFVIGFWSIATNLLFVQGYAYSTKGEATVGTDGNVQDITTLKTTTNIHNNMNNSDVSSWSILTNIFPNTLETLSQVWEIQPVFLPGSSVSSISPTLLEKTTLMTLFLDSTQEEDDDEETEAKEEKGPTLNEQQNRFSHLFSESAFFKIISNPSFRHGVDYTALKIHYQDGEEWTGKINLPEIPPDHLIQYLNQMDYSILISVANKKWRPVYEFSRTLEKETMSHAVTTNIYVTPPGGARGFETHMDWMDVIVVQVIGEKDWTVWTKPLTYLCQPDEKRKPTPKELKETKALHSTEVRLKPGDALYIPRGFLHHAVTPSDSTSVSVHLTFGIEHNCVTTIEALLHHAVHIFIYNDGTTVDLSRSKVISRSYCKPIQSDTPIEILGLDFERVLHLAISEVVRRTNCGGLGEQNQLDRGEQDTIKICALRHSLPLHPIFQSIPSHIQDKSREQLAKEYFFQGVQAIASHISVTNAINFHNEIILPLDPRHGSKEYCHGSPEHGRDLRYECNPGGVKRTAQRKFPDFVADFVEFVTNDETNNIYNRARDRLMDTLKILQEKTRKNQDEWMNSLPY